MPLLCGACPSFEARWQAYVAVSIYDEELFYVHLGEFASHLVDLMVNGRLSELPIVFETIERVYVDSDYDVRLAITVGLLEGIQNVSGDKTAPEKFVAYLGPRTAEQWQLLNESWNGDIEATRRLGA
jgi:hypothetical protein